MKNRVILQVILMGLVLLLIPQLGTAREQGANSGVRPNILFIPVDDLNVAHNIIDRSADSDGRVGTSVERDIDRCRTAVQAIVQRVDIIASIECICTFSGHQQV